MSDLFWLTDEQIERLRPFTGRLPLDERQVLAEAANQNAIGERRILVKSRCQLRASADPEADI